MGSRASHGQRKKVLASDHREHQGERGCGQLIRPKPPDDQDGDGLDRILEDICKYH